MSFYNDISIIVVSCASGVSPYLEQELVALGFPVAWRGETAVETEGSLEDAMRLNLHLRTGHRVFYMLGEFRARDPDELYERTIRLPWEDYIYPDGYFTVDASTDTPTITNDQFAALRVKDAIADRIRDVCGQRPDSGNEIDGVCVFLHWTGQNAAVYLNTSGGALSRRGYRVASSATPMRESLAAAVVMASGWKGEGHFLNPMCGGATIAIEAAWIAANRAPGLLRQDFSFMHLRGFEMSAWRNLRQQAIAAIKPQIPGRIIASDIDDLAVRASRANAAEAGVEHLIEFDGCDISFSPVPEEALADSVIVINPPYGARLGDAVKLQTTYEEIGNFLKRNAANFRGYVFTANPDLVEMVGLQASRTMPFFNGPLEARLLEYGDYDPGKSNPEAGFSGDASISAT